MNTPASRFNLSAVFSTLARALPDQRALVWRGRELSFADIDRRVDGVAHFLHSLGLGCHTERAELADHESGQDHLGLYLRNGNEYLEAMLGGYRARLAPFNVNYRYVDAELVYLLGNSTARALVYHAEFAPRVAEIRDQLPQLQTLIQVADHSGNALLPGAIDYGSIVATPAPSTGMPVPSPDDLYLLYTGGTTGMPKGVMWRQHDIFVSSMGGRQFGTDEALRSYEELAARASAAPGAISILLIPPLMHGAAQWGTFQVMAMGGWVAFPDDVVSMQPEQIVRFVERERVVSIPVVGDAVARPIIDEIERGGYDLPNLLSISNGGAPLTPTIRQRFHAAVPHLLVIDAVGASESGLQMNAVSTKGAQENPAAFTPGAETAVISPDMTCVLDSAGEGWLARRGYIPLAYLDDAAKTAATFPTIDGMRWSVPGDRARVVDNGCIELLGRESVTINSGGEKIFAEEVEAAVTAHPAVYDVIVTSRPSERWGNEVIAVVQLIEGATVSDDEIIQVCSRRIARYKLPKAIIRKPKLQRSPSGKADYRWAKTVAAETLPTSQLSAQ